jgi:enamine deaminase RidA (YjgF/YER057c/UK114 family)
VKEERMVVELVNPDGLPKPEAYFQAAIASGSRTVYLSGQVARNAQGEAVGEGDLAAQVEQAFLNVATALAGLGGSFDDVAKLTVYVVDWTGDKMDALLAGAVRAAERLGINPVKPTTLIGVAALGEPDLLVEVDAIAVLP